MKRQLKGFGSVYLESRTRRKPYVARITIGYDDNGKQIKKKIGYFEHYHEAIVALTKYHEEDEIENKKSTFFNIYKEFLIWKKASINEKTFKAYDYTYNLYLKTFSDRDINDISFFEFQNLLLNTDKSHSTKKAIKSLLVGMYDLAMLNKIVNTNIVKSLNIGPPVKIKTKRPFNKEEIDILFDNVNKVENIDLVLILIYTGLRATELVNLKVENIDLNERTFRAGIKTKAGTNRCIGISYKIIELIKNRIENRKEGYLIHNDNKAITYAKLKKLFDEVMIKLNMDHTPHEARHTFATLLSNANANTASIAKLIGHSNYLTTEKIYTHKEIDDLLSAIDSL